MKWLFNFSASPAGGGLRRLEESSKWFDGRGGATFLVHPKALPVVAPYAQENRYIAIRQSKWKRLVAEGGYLPEVLADIGTPDVYFSYGIPLPHAVGRLTWLHVSNALTLTRERHGMALKRYCELQLLGNRLVRSLRHAGIASGESEYTLQLLRKAQGPVGHSCKYTVVDNGCEDALFHRERKRLGPIEGEYAITVGTAPYKRLEQALAVFGVLQESHPALKRFKIVGDIRQIPRKVLDDVRVEALGSGISNEDLYGALEEARFYISASGIENSSIAATEAILLCQGVVLSDIPSHREAVQGIEQTKLQVPGEKAFIAVKGVGIAGPVQPSSWSDVLEKMVAVASEWTSPRT